VKLRCVARGGGASKQLASSAGVCPRSGRSICAASRQLAGSIRACSASFANLVCLIFAQQRFDYLIRVALVHGASRLFRGCADFDPVIGQGDPVGKVVGRMRSNGHRNPPASGAGYQTSYFPAPRAGDYPAGALQTGLMALVRAVLVAGERSSGFDHDCRWAEVGQAKAEIGSSFTCCGPPAPEEAVGLVHPQIAGC